MVDVKWECDTRESCPFLYVFLYESKLDGRKSGRVRLRERESGLANKMSECWSQKVIIKRKGHKRLNISLHGWEVGKMKLQLDSQKQWTQIRRAYQIYERMYVYINERCTKIRLHFHHLLVIHKRKRKPTTGLRILALSHSKLVGSMVT